MEMRDEGHLRQLLLFFCKQTFEIFLLDIVNVETFLYKNWIFFSNMPSISYCGTGAADWKTKFIRRSDNTVRFYMLPPVKYPDGISLEYSDLVFFVYLKTYIDLFLICPRCILNSKNKCTVCFILKLPIKEKLLLLSWSKLYYLCVAGVQSYDGVLHIIMTVIRL